MGLRGIGLLAFFVVIVASGSARAGDVDLVHLELRYSAWTVEESNTFRVQLYALTDAPEGRRFSSMAAILSWDPSVLQLIGMIDIEDYNWFVSAFPDGTYDVDEFNVTWQDGDAYYLALGQFPLPGFSYPFAGPAGLHIVDFVFRAIAPTPGTLIEMPVTVGKKPDTETEVLDHLIPNNPVTGALLPAEVRVGAYGDNDDDTDVDLKDIAALQNCYSGANVPHAGNGCGLFDYNADGDVDPIDYRNLRVDIVGP